MLPTREDIMAIFARGEAARRLGIRAWVSRKTPVALTAKEVVKASGVLVLKVSAEGLIIIPAMLRRRSTGVEPRVAEKAAMESGEVTLTSWWAHFRDWMGSPIVASRAWTVYPCVKSLGKWLLLLLV
jgi:hypothetical protein